MARPIEIIDSENDDDQEDSNWGGRKWPFFWWSIITALVLLFLWPHVIIKIEPGFVGVLYRRFLGGTELDYIFREGTHSIFPWDTMYLYDAKLQENTYEFSILNKSGLLVTLEITVIYQPIANETPSLLTNVGLDYKEKLIKPMMRATVVDIIAKHSTEELFNETISIIRDEILIGMISTLGRLPVKVHNILIRSVKLPKDLNQAINDKLVAQQRVYEKSFLVLQSLEDYKRAYVEASSVRMAQEIVNPLMTEQFLLYKGIEATKQVATSPNSKVVIIGNKDGLPLILNLEGSAAPGGAASAALPAVTVGPEPTPDAATVTPKPAEPAAGVQLLPPDGKSLLDRVNPDRINNVIGPLGEALGLPVSDGQQGATNDPKEIKP
jgi:regulator of protease activity HflC (stomatin/prohibitin superfamily)